MSDTWLEKVTEALQSLELACSEHGYARAHKEAPGQVRVTWWANGMRAAQNERKRARADLLALVTEGRCPVCGGNAGYPDPLQVVSGRRRAGLLYCAVCNWTSEGRR